MSSPILLLSIDKLMIIVYYGTNTNSIGSLPEKLSLYPLERNQEILVY